MNELDEKNKILESPHNFRKFFSCFGMAIESVHDAKSHLLVVLYVLLKNLNCFQNRGISTGGSCCCNKQPKNWQETIMKWFCKPKGSRIFQKVSESRSFFTEFRVPLWYHCGIAHFLSRGKLCFSYMWCRIWSHLPNCNRMSLSLMLKEERLGEPTAYSEILCSVLDTQNNR